MAFEWRKIYTVVIWSQWEHNTAYENKIINTPCVPLMNHIIVQDSTVKMMMMMMIILNTDVMNNSYWERGNA